METKQNPEECTNTCKCKHCVKKPSYMDKWRFTLYTVIFALLIFNPFTYQLTQKLIESLTGILLINKHRCINKILFGIHLVIFTLITRYSMDFDI